MYVNQQESAGCLSSALFTWLTPLLRLGKKRTLTLEDIFVCPSESLAKSAEDRLQEYVDNIYRSLKYNSQH